MTPELRARTKIDQQLVQAGWLVQHKDDFNRNAGVGVAVREFSLPPGPCDYLLFVGGKAAGVIEAKPAGTTLSGVAEQAGKYMDRLPEHLARWADTLLFDYESTGEETLFRDVRDPDARSRRVFTFHRPETLLRWAEARSRLRGRLRQMPPLDMSGLRLCQVEAIAGSDDLAGLERSFARSDPRALIQMATGAGKTFTACTFCYRLIKFADANHPGGLHWALGDGVLAAEERRETLRLAVGEAQRVIDGGAAAVGVPGPAVGVALNHAGTALDLDEEEALGREHEDVDLVDPALVVDELEVRPRAPGLVLR